MKLLFSRGTLALSLAFAASAAIDAVSAADFEGRPLKERDLLRDDMNMPSFEPYDSGSIKTLIVSYRDEAGHDNVAAHATAMKSQGRAIKEASNVVFSKQHKISGKAGKARRARGLQDEQDDLAFDFAQGISFVTVDTATEDFDAEVAALENIEGVSSVEEDALMHILSTPDMEHQPNLRGVKAADHISEIQDAMKAAANALPVPEDKIDYSPSHEGRERRLVEQVPYGITMVNTSFIPELPPTDDPIKICVVDTGYDPTHQDLPNEAQHNVVGHKGTGLGGAWNVDGHGHGTHCAGTIGAIGDNAIGVTSVNPDPSKFQFIIGKGLSDSGGGTHASVMSAVTQCVEKGAKVISMSLGGGGYSESTNAFYDDIYDTDVLIIAAAGNSGNSAKSYPASYPVVMSVGSVTSSRTRSSFSQYNDQVEIAAPGSLVKSTLPNNSYASWSGTSMATPHVAGVAALLWSHFPDCKNNQIRNAMIHSAAAPPTNSAGWTAEYGWGIVNAGYAYELLSTGCETAGGLATPLNDQELSDIAYGGKDQKNKGCTLDAHCDQFNFCHVETSECVASPPTPTPPPTVPPPCPSGQKRYQVTITTDNYPGETNYVLKNTCTGNQVLTGCGCGIAGSSFPSAEVCAEAGEMEFVINDTYGDGLCCNYGQGGYVVTEDGVTKASGGTFASTETKTWGECGTLPPTNPPTAPPTNPPTPPPTTPPPSNPPTNVVTPPPTNPVTPPPTSGDAETQFASFDASYGVPRCTSIGSSCDSVDLLNGKGTMNNGNEPNRSNTNKNGQVCNDGNSGSYHYDESIDKITVTAGDLDSAGNPVPSGGYIVEGGRAFVTVNLWCWGTGTSDRADIFLSSDASSPNWQSLTTITCPGNGAQTIRHAFDVPSGANQSIRVNFRYNGSPSTCSSGSYDDHDDLIFAVKSSSGGPPPTPPPVASPPSAGPSGPQTASFDAGLGAPKCSFGSSCDSDGLLNGRGTIANGNEPNKPNTLNSCSDGSYGSHHSDESIDKIVVSRTDGGTGDFTEGDEVTITANIWCWSTGSSDYIDFYYASNAANPVWNQIGARQVCPGGQSQTVSKTFQLPAGGLQAVRVNLMYGSGTPGTNKCTSGGYDDTDDLVISVKPNPNANAILAASMALPHDDVQAFIVEMVHDERADQEAAALVELNASVKEGDESSNTGSKSGKGSSANAATVSSTSKYVCTKSEPLDATICADGKEADNKCSFDGENCGKKKKCYFAECEGFKADE